LGKIVPYNEVILNRGYRLDSSPTHWLTKFIKKRMLNRGVSYNESAL